MKLLKSIPFFDFLGIALSFLCLIHCLALPFLVSFLPAMMGEFSEHESVHLILSLFILPISLLAVLPAYQKHRKKRVFVFMGTGLLLILGAMFFGHDLLGEKGEKIMTLGGGCLLIWTHIQNRSFCHSCPKCETHETPKAFFKSHF